MFESTRERGDREITSVLSWHPRALTTKRKHLPPNDVAAAGGWLDTGTLQQCYQQRDMEVLPSVVKFERFRPPAPGWLQVSGRPG
jgi:hypothetical protein